MRRERSQVNAMRMLASECDERGGKKCVEGGGELMWWKRQREMVSECGE